MLVKITSMERKFNTLSIPNSELSNYSSSLGGIPKLLASQMMKSKMGSREKFGGDCLLSVRVGRPGNN